MIIEVRVTPVMLKLYLTLNEALMTSLANLNIRLLVVIWQRNESKTTITS